MPDTNKVPAAHPTLYRIFVSGPADVSADMEVVKSAIAEASLLTNPLGVRFEAFDWHEVSPGMAEEAQARINEQIGGYHAFLSIMGGKVGSPTKNYSSGTIEEVEIALKSINALLW
jgi:hypothetical protein